MKNKHIKEFVDITPEALVLLKQAVNTYNLSARTYFRLIKVSQTIADLAESKKILPNHVAEALQYRVRSNDWQVTYDIPKDDISGFKFSLAMQVNFLNPAISYIIMKWLFEIRFRCDNNFTFF